MLEDFSSKKSRTKILLKSELSEFWESCYYLLDIFVQNLLNKRFYKCTSSTVVNNVAKAAARLYKDKALKTLYLP